MSSKIVDILPRHTVYVEPFCGGAAVMFAKPWPPVSDNNHYREVISDTSGDLVNLYRVIADPKQGPELVRRLQFTPYSREIHRDTKQLKGNAIDRAYAYYIQAQMSFSNQVGAGWGTSVYGHNYGATWINRLTRLPQYLARMSGIHIDCFDAIEVIKRWDSPHTLFYCDPPYPGACQGHYSGYTLEHFHALVAALSDARGSFVLSNYEQPGVPDKWERFEFAAVNSSSNTRRGGHREKRTEVCWRVDRSATARPEIHEIWKRWGWQEGVGMGQVKWIAAKSKKK